MSQKPLNFREADFIRHVNNFPQYSKRMRDEFIAYWTEPNKSASKMRFEQEKTWDLARRLARWANNPFNRDKAEGGKVVHMTMPKEKKAETDIEKLDLLLSRYVKNPSAITIDGIVAWSGLDEIYRALKENRLWDHRITKKDLDGFRDEKRLKAFVILRTLDYYGLSGYTFSSTIDLRNKMAK